MLGVPTETALPFRLDAAARKAYTIPFGPGSRMLFYTDGIGKARDRAGVFYTMDRSHALLAGLDPDAALGRLYRDVLRHADGPLRHAAGAAAVPAPRARRGDLLPGRISLRLRPTLPGVSDAPDGESDHPGDQQRRDVGSQVSGRANLPGLLGHPQARRR